MNLNEQFKLKFNELDQLCKTLYPKHQKGFDALRQFAYSLEGNNKSTLLNLIKARNMNTHDDTNIISFNKEAIQFIQGLINGAKRRVQGGPKLKIDAECENLRSKNLNIMNSKMNFIISKYSFLNKSDIDKIRRELNEYITKEKSANNIDSIKKHYFDFLNSVKLIESTPAVKNARSERKAQNLENAKSKAINEIEQMFTEVISETSLFNVVVRNKANLLKKSAISSIYRCKSFYEIENIIEDFEEKFDDLCY